MRLTCEFVTRTLADLEPGVAAETNMIGLAVVAICGTVIYLSVTYGGGGLGFLKGVFK